MTGCRTLRIEFI